MKTLSNNRLNTIEADGRVIALENAMNSAISFGNLTVNNLVVTNDAVVYGNITLLDSETVQILDNVILLNASGGNGFTQAGFNIDRGQLDTVQMVWDAPSLTFRVGAIGSTARLAAMQDNPLSGFTPFISVDDTLVNATTMNVNQATIGEWNTTTTLFSTSNLLNLTSDTGTFGALQDTYTTTTNVVNVYLTTANLATTNLQSSFATIEQGNITHLETTTAISNDTVYDNLVTTDVIADNIAFSYVSLNNLVLSQPTVGILMDQLVTTNVSTNTLQANRLEGYALSVSDATLTNLVVANITTVSFPITDTTITNLVYTNMSANTLHVISLTGQNVTITNATGSMYAINAVASQATIANGSFINVSTVSLNTTNTTISNAVISNASVASATANLVNAVSMVYTDATIGALTSLNYEGNVTCTYLNASTLGTNTLTAQYGTLSNLVTTNTSIGTLLGVSMTTSNMTAGTSVIPTVIASNVTLSNSVITSESVSTFNGVHTNVGTWTTWDMITTNHTAVNWKGVNVSGGEIYLSNATIGVLNATNGVFSTLTGVNAVLTNVTLLTSTLGNAIVSNTTSGNGVLTVVSSGVLLSTNMNVVNASGVSYINSIDSISNLVSTNVWSTNTSITNFNFTNNTTINLLVSNTTVVNTSVSFMNTTNITTTNLQSSVANILFGHYQNLTSINGMLIASDVSFGNMDTMSVGSMIVTNVTASSGVIGNMSNENSVVTTMSGNNGVFVNITSPSTNLDVMSATSWTMYGTGGADLIFNNQGTPISFSSQAFDIAIQSTQVLSPATSTFGSVATGGSGVVCRSYIPINASSNAPNGTQAFFITAGASLVLNQPLVYYGNTSTANTVNSLATTVASVFAPVSTSSNIVVTGAVTINNANTALYDIGIALIPNDVQSQLVYSSRYGVNAAFQTIGTSISSGTRSFNFTSVSFSQPTSQFYLALYLGNSGNTSIGSGNSTSFANIELSYVSSNYLTKGRLITSIDTSPTFTTTTQVIGGTTGAVITGPVSRIPLPMGNITVSASSNSQTGGTLTLVACGLTSGPFSTIGSTMMLTSISQTSIMTNASLQVLESPFYLQLLYTGISVPTGYLVSTSSMSLSSGYLLKIGTSSINETGGQLFTKNFNFGNISTGFIDATNTTLASLTILNNSFSNTTPFNVQNVLPVFRLGTCTVANLVSQLSTATSMTRGLLFSGMTLGSSIISPTTSTFNTFSTTFLMVYGNLFQNNNVARITGEYAAYSTVASGQTLNLTLNLSNTAGFRQSLGNILLTGSVPAGGYIDTTISNPDYTTRSVFSSTTTSNYFFNVIGGTASDSSVVLFTMANVQISFPAPCLQLGNTSNASAVYYSGGKFQINSPAIHDGSSMTSNGVCLSSALIGGAFTVGNASATIPHLAGTKSYYVSWSITTSGNILTLPAFANIPDGTMIHIDIFSTNTATATINAPGQNIYSANAGNTGDTYQVFIVNQLVGITANRYRTFELICYQGLGVWVNQWGAF